jgi:DNA-binding LytR/AlgR family response regulator
MQITVFIVDDEAPARRELRFLLEQIDGILVAGEAANGSEALKGLKKYHPDLLFLDIQMPGLSGLELAEVIGQLPNPPLLVFATAYQEFALPAFEVQAFDYLLKPFAPERLQQTIMKAYRHLTGSETASAEAPFAKVSKIPLYRGETIIPTSPDQIMFVCSEQGENRVQVGSESLRSRWTLQELERRLAPFGFFRPHRSWLVNCDHVREVVPWFGGSYKLVMADKERTEIQVSRYQIKELKQRFTL